MPDYWEVVTKSIARVHAAGGRLLVRHLLMPGHFHCCTEPVLRWLATLAGAEVSLLTQYLAPAQARGELAGELAEGDVVGAEKLATDLGLTLVR
jgi:putative pyruvate formate lyase activating enzyme